MRGFYRATTLPLVLAVILASLIAACAPSRTGSTYEARQLGRVANVARGTVVSMREVDIGGTSTGSAPGPAPSPAARPAPRSAAAPAPTSSARSAAPSSAAFSAPPPNRR